MGLSKLLDNKAVSHLEVVLGWNYFLRLRTRAGAEEVALELERWADA